MGFNNNELDIMMEFLPATSNLLEAVVSGEEIDIKHDFIPSSPRILPRLGPDTSCILPSIFPKTVFSSRRTGFGTRGAEEHRTVSSSAYKYLWASGIRVCISLVSGLSDYIMLLTTFF